MYTQHPKGGLYPKRSHLRKLKEIDLAQPVDDMSLQEIKTENVNEMVVMLEENFSTALNNQAPEVTKVITERKRNHGLEMI